MGRAGVPERNLENRQVLASPFSEADVPHAIEHKPKRDPKLEILNLSLYPDECQYRCQLHLCEAIK